jgi:ribosomal protein L16/L10AE
MGKGKGSIDSYYGRVIRGSKIIELEVTGGNLAGAVRALKKVKGKLGQGTRIEIIRA